MHPAVVSALLDSALMASAPTGFKVRYIQPVDSSLWHELRHYPQHLWAKKLTIHCWPDGSIRGYTLDWLND